MSHQSSNDPLNPWPGHNYYILGGEANWYDLSDEEKKQYLKEDKVIPIGLRSAESKTNIIDARTGKPVPFVKYKSKTLTDLGEFPSPTIAAQRINVIVDAINARLLDNRFWMLGFLSPEKGFGALKTLDWGDNPNTTGNKNADSQYQQSIENNEGDNPIILSNTKGNNFGIYTGRHDGSGKGKLVPGTNLIENYFKFALAPQDTTLSWNDRPPEERYAGYKPPLYVFFDNNWAKNGQTRRKDEILPIIENLKKEDIENNKIGLYIFGDEFLERKLINKMGDFYYLSPSPEIVEDDSNTEPKAVAVGLAVPFYNAIKEERKLLEELKKSQETNSTPRSSPVTGLGRPDLVPQLRFNFLDDLQRRTIKYFQESLAKKGGIGQPNLNVENESPGFVDPSQTLNLQNQVQKKLDEEQGKTTKRLTFDEFMKQEIPISTPLQKGRSAGEYGFDSQIYKENFVRIQKGNEQIYQLLSLQIVWGADKGKSGGYTFEGPINVLKFDGGDYGYYRDGLVNRASYYDPKLNILYGKKDEYLAGNAYKNLQINKYNDSTRLRDIYTIWSTDQTSFGSNLKITSTGQGDDQPRLQLEKTVQSKYTTKPFAYEWDINKKSLNEFLKRHRNEIRKDLFQFFQRFFGEYATFQLESPSIYDLQEKNHSNQYTTDNVAQGQPVRYITALANEILKGTSIYDVEGRIYLDIQNRPLPKELDIK